MTIPIAKPQAVAVIPGFTSPDGEIYHAVPQNSLQARRGSCYLLRDMETAASTEAAAARSLAGRPELRIIGTLALGHLVIDMLQGAVPAILPLLKTANGLTYAASGTLVLVGNTASSLIQPIFGFLADRVSGRWLLPLAVLASGLGMALSGVVRGYLPLVAMFLILSLGVAAYHPEGFKKTALAAGRRRATALSWFSLGGNLGFALGPPVVMLLVTDLGTYGTLGMFLPALLMSTGLWLTLPKESGSPHGSVSSRPPSECNRPRAMALLMFVVAVRSWAHLGFVTYLPFFYVDRLGLAPKVVGPLLFVFLGSGALGTVIAGPLADRWGAKPTMLAGLIGAVPFGVLFLHLNGAASWIVLGLFGAVLISTATITVLLSQQYLPRNTGLASGLVVGLAIGAGGLGVALLGWVADHFGLLTVLWMCALMPLTGFAAALFLPSSEEEGRRRQ